MSFLRAKYAPATAGTAIPWPCLLAAASCLLSAGCNNGRQLQTDLYQRELRLQEDEIYRLEDYVDEYQEIIKGYRCELAEVREKLAERQAIPTAVERTPESLPTPADQEYPDKPEPLDLDPAGDDIMPEIEIPDPAIETSTPDVPGTSPADAAPKFEAAPLFDSSSNRPRSDARLAALEVTPDSPIEELRTTSATTDPIPLNSPPAPYPHAADAKPITPPIGLDESLAIQLQPGPTADQAPTTLTVLVTEARAGGLARFEGEASVMLTDPSVEGGRRRIARWDFTADEVASSWMAGSESTLELPIALPSTTPIDQSLRVWVRLTDARGKKRLQASPLRLSGEVGRIEIASVTPRRLPSTHEPVEPASFSVAEASAAQPIDEWRPAGERPRPRSIDPALLPASFESE